VGLTQTPGFVRALRPRERLARLGRAPRKRLIEREGGSSSSASRARWQHAAAHGRGARDHDSAGDRHDADPTRRRRAPRVVAHVSARSHAHLSLSSQHDASDARAIRGTNVVPIRAATATHQKKGKHVSACELPLLELHGSGCDPGGRGFKSRRSPLTESPACTPAFQFSGRPARRNACSMCVIGRACSAIVTAR
jgi:hypothetical protein